MKTKKLDVIEYKNVVKDDVIAFFDDYDGSFVTLITPRSTITIKPHYYKGIFMGYNIRCDGELLETKSTKNKAVKFVKKLIR